MRNLIKYKNYILYATVFIIAAFNCFSQVRIERIAVGPLNRLIVFFNEFPVKYKSDLSEDKKKITLEISNVQVLESARYVKSTGAIVEAYAGPNKRDAIVSVILANSGGYSVAEAPYSKALIIETFNWNSLAPGEEQYRTGLLGLEDKILASAKSDFLNSVKEGYANSATALGVLLLQEGKYNSALKNLLYAESKGSNLPDLYAAIAQIYTSKGDQVKARKYSDLFIQKTGLKSVTTLNLPESIEKDTICSEPVAHLIIANVNKDTAKAPQNDPNARFNKLFNDSTKKANGENNSLINFYSETFTMAAAVVLGFALLIIYLYLKWRNKQILQAAGDASNLNSNKKGKAGEFAKSLDKAKAGVKPKKINKKENLATKAYKEKSGSIFDKTITENDELIISNPETKPTQEKPYVPDAQLDKNDKIVQILESLKNIKEQKEEKFDEQGIETVYSDDMKPKAKPVSAKVELAMHLAQEQQKIKQANIDSLNQDKFSPDKEKLSEVAKRLGIEKGSLETKKALDNIKNDADKMSKLEEKFSALKK